MSLSNGSNMDGLWGLHGGTTVRSSSTRSLRDSKEEKMRRFRTLLLGGLMMVALLIGTGGTAAAARPSVSGVSGATGWLCTPHGSGGLAPTTYISSALIFQNNMSRSTITCFFQNIGGPTSTISGPGSLLPGGLLPSHLELGGNCYYNAGQRPALSSATGSTRSSATPRSSSAGTASSSAWTPWGLPAPTSAKPAPDRCPDASGSDPRVDHASAGPASIRPVHPCSTNDQAQGVVLSGRGRDVELRVDLSSTSRPATNQAHRDDDGERKPVRLDATPDAQPDVGQRRRARGLLGQPRNLLPDRWRRSSSELARHDAPSNRRFNQAVWFRRRDIDLPVVGEAERAQVGQPPGGGSGARSGSPPPPRSGRARPVP